MALAGSLQWSYDLGLCKNQGYNKQFKKVVAGRGQLHLLSSSLSSSNSLQQWDSLGFHRPNIAYRPIRSMPYKYNGIRCQWSLVPDKTLGLPYLRTAAVKLVGSLDAVQGGNPVPKLIPAVGLILFTIWGLGPLLRLSRNLLLRKNDSNWKKSNTHYVMTSYLRPLLLWAGAIFVCRVLDPIVLPSESSQVVKQRLLNFVGSLSTVLAFAYCLSSVIQQTQKFFMESGDSNDTRKMGFDFAGKAVYSAVWVAAVSLFMELLGFSTQKWLTAGGLGTVLLTLAGREIFTNFLSSAMIHATRPFIVNEWIQTRIEGYDVSGTVEHVGWWSPTIVRGEEREAVHIPNHKFTMNVVRNLTQKTHWRIKTHLAISHLDCNKINNIVADMRKVLAKNPNVEQQRLHRRVFLENVNPENQALLILVSCFVKTSHFEEYLCVKEAILLDLLRVISHHRARLATPIRTVQKIYSDADLDNVPFADSIFRRGGGGGGSAPKRPLLLIEPSYRINGDDKTKTQLRSTRSSASDIKGDAKSGENPSSDSSKDLDAAAASMSNPKVSERGTTKSTPKPVSSTNSNVAETSTSNSKESPSGPDVSFQYTSPQSNQPKKASAGNDKQNGKLESPPSPKTETGADKASRSQQKQDGPTTHPALEENILLGVALEGSKRTLPIDEDMTTPEEERELAARRHKNGSTSTEKDKKDGQVSTAPGPTPTPSDQ